MKEKVLNFGNRCLEEITVKKILIIMLGAGICSFGIHNIHQRTNITEGGVIGTNISDCIPLTTVKLIFFPPFYFVLKYFE